MSSILERREQINESFARAESLVDPVDRFEIKGGDLIAICKKRGDLEIKYQQVAFGTAQIPSQKINKGRTDQFSQSINVKLKWVRIS